MITLKCKVKHRTKRKLCYSAIAMSDPTYDVFLSFRGEDTRDNFTSHLYAELCRQNIETFIDNRLDRGEEISPALYKAIQESTIYVIILSQHYASSSWCLDELIEILKCKERYEREVIPVFYKVDPSNVRHQRQSYADDLVKHHQRFGDKVDAWKASLTQVAGLSGWDSQKTRPESTLVTEIVEDIVKKLNRCVPSDYEEMTGIDNHIEKIQSLLLLESPTVQIIGIWGMGGIGKTTIAKAIFDKLGTHFGSKSIIRNVQQEIERAGLSHVKKEYLSQLLNETITSSESNSYDQRLKRTKGLIVFDDVKDADQLKDLIGTHHKFGSGSRIIVTSRDRQVLENANAHEIYQVREMDDQDSLQLFCLCAFKQKQPIESFASLTEKVLAYAQGLPLALKVLGSLLYGKSEKVWESELQKLKKLPDLNIFRLLKLSYDGLDDEQKNIFLDIACFYTGEPEKAVALALDSSGFSASKGIDDLSDRILISISNGRVWMHDLIQEMGHEIVRLQCANDPGKRSRLWKTNDVYDVLSKNKGKGTDAIQCIFLNMDEIKNVQLHADTFKKMHNLRMIKFYTHFRNNSNVTFHAFLKRFPNDLKFLRWDGFPQRSLPQDFCPKNLATLDMSYSHLEQLWEGDQALPNLKRLNLSYSKKLVRVPDLSLSPNIEEIILTDCISLVQVYSSSFLDKLNWLYLAGCTKLERLDVRSNILSRSSGLVALPNCYKLEKLLISGRTDVVQSYNCSDFYVYSNWERKIFVSKSMAIELNNAGDYEICDLDSNTIVRSINDLCWLDISNCRSLTCLPAELFNSKFLRRLCLRSCLQLEELPEIKETMENLKVLILDETAIKELPSSLHLLVGLEELSLQCCKKLKAIPSSIGNLSKLLELELTYCESLETFLSSIFKLKLTRLDFYGCPMLGTFPEIPNEVGRLSSLTELSLQGSSIVNLPESIAHLSSLRSLNLSDCKLLECVPKLPPNLNQVLAFDCHSMKRMMLNSGSDSKEGIAVPDWFPHRCQGHSISISSDDLYLYERNRLIGFALCVVLGHDFPYEISRFDISFAYALKFESDGRIHLRSNKLEVEYDRHRLGHNRRISQHNTFLWKYKLNSSRIGRFAEAFTFEILDGNRRLLSYPTTMMVKECGIYPLYAKENDDNSIHEPSGDGKRDQTNSVSRCRWYEW
ncbi:disease resistance protein RPV1-like isoform X2 [Trifolium pratense]|uniref:disease resistance protein RPV1-like isoform X2 n=1 Tax=Trifolium pratense TaxID=57577 RepID=UPI001E694804|nr:disease resistance protein RPV1-like isoform X2 [Trifolium pratense]